MAPNFRPEMGLGEEVVVARFTPWVWLLATLGAVGCSEDVEAPVATRVDERALSDTPNDRSIAISSSLVGGDSDGASPPPVPTEQARVRTWLSSEDMMIALARGYELAFGRVPGDAVLAGVYGLVALENDSGEALYGFNFGNLGAPGSDAPWTRDPSGSRMRTFETAEEGAAALWRTLFTDHRTALRAFEGAEIDVAVGALEQAGYFEADGGRYRKSVPVLARRADRTILPTLRHRAGLAGMRLSELPITPRYERTSSVATAHFQAEGRL